MFMVWLYYLTIALPWGGNTVKHEIILTPSGSIIIVYIYF